jgi:hypothetical protein
MNVEKHNKPNGSSVRDEKDCLLCHHITIYNLTILEVEHFKHANHSDKFATWYLHELDGMGAI